MPRMLLMSGLLLSFVWALVVFGIEQNPVYSIIGIAPSLQKASLETTASKLESNFNAQGTSAAENDTVMSNRGPNGEEVSKEDDMDDDKEYGQGLELSVSIDDDTEEGGEVVQSTDFLEFSIETEYPDPVLFIRISGPWCHDDALEWKQVFLTDGMQFGSNLMELTKRDQLNETHFKLYFSLSIDVPCPGTVSLHWRLEYSSMADALVNYPASKCSFLGNISSSMTKEIAADSYLINDKADAKWLVRQSEETVWHWYKGDTRTCEVRDEIPITVMGDSQPSYMCAQWQTRRPNTYCEVNKGPLSNRTIVDNYLKALKTSSRGGVLLINVAGLWETAYGDTNLYKYRLEEILHAALQSSFQHIFYLTTTTVHPIHYKKIFTDRRKWAMTAPRVHVLNLIARDVVESTPFAEAFHLIDLEPLSFGGEHDPMTPTDMRHYGAKTNEVFSDYTACQIIRMKPSLAKSRSLRALAKPLLGFMG